MNHDDIRSLTSAALAGKLETCRALLDAGIEPDATTPEDESPAINRAASGGHLEVLELLLGRGARVDGTPTTRVTPLLSAAMGGHLDVVRRLVEAGADIHRESLTQPLTPTGAAEYWSFLGKGQAEVAAYLRSLGGTNPYNDPSRPADVWEGVEGEMHIELFERVLNGKVHPEPFVRTLSGGRSLPIRTSRFSAPKFFFRSLFTVSLSDLVGLELALVLSREWPLHAEALGDPRFAWPLDFLATVASRAMDGLSVAHGDVLSRDDLGVGEAVWPATIDAWLVVRHASLEERRVAVPQAGLRPTYFLVPHMGKKRLTPGDEAKKAADALAAVKWEKAALGPGKKRLIIPLELLEAATGDVP